MSVTTASNRFISTSAAGLYQGLQSSGLSFEGAANRLIQYAEIAHAFRQYDKVRVAGEILSSFPLSQYQYIGQYYLALSLCRNGLGNLQQARPLLEKLASLASPPHRARVLQLIAATYGVERKPEHELYFYLESLKTRVNTFTALRSIAVLKAKEGYHQQALKDLEGLHSFARFVPPIVYFDYLNSLAVELGEVGRKYEARNIIQAVIASPFAPAYPEWQETARDLRPANRSFVVIDPSPPRMGRLLTMPSIERTEPVKQEGPARVLSLQEWKRKTGRDKTSGDELPENISEKEMVVKLMNLLISDRMSYDRLCKIKAYAEKVVSEPEDTK